MRWEKEAAPLKGVPVQEEVVSKETLPAAVEAGKRVAPDGTQELKSPEQVLSDRQAAAGAENSNIVQLVNTAMKPVMDKLATFETAAAAEQPRSKKPTPGSTTQ